MKISFTRGFDTEDVIKRLKEGEVEGLDEFVTNVAETLDKLSLFVQKNISLLDNVDQVTKDLALSHGRSITFDAPIERKRVKAILPTQCSGWENPITSFNWRINAAGKVEVIAWFQGNPQTPQTVTMSIYH